VRVLLRGTHGAITCVHLQTLRREREEAETIDVSSWLIRSQHREIDLLDA
jgi:hypothetical protein